MGRSTATRFPSVRPSEGMGANDPSVQVQEGLLTVEEVGRYLGVNVRHVRRLVQERRLRFVKWGRLLRFDPADVQRFVEDHRSVL